MQICTFSRLAEQMLAEKNRTADAAREVWAAFRNGKATYEEAIAAQRAANIAWTAESNHWDPERMKNKGY